ncbi:YoaK family protein [Streptococcus sp. DD12]|uniref:YoaK family protein n=1 Tax=Streptococcus sp. DD12 TaxID=1777880 RepID=UPI000798063B|nr:YoaK family protein [Streptococcus sp. DD12]KXT76107.1 putative membrane protein [Streptococcus sp. DD12]
MLSWLTIEKDYRIFEGFRTALTLTFVSGFIDAYTYLTQDHSFAGMQTGNVIYMIVHFASNEWHQGLVYVLPILVFMLGQVFIYVLRKMGRRFGFHWHVVSGQILLLLLIVTSFLAPFYQKGHLPIMVLSFYASVQLETFKKIRGMPYTGIMMTGNIRVLSALLCQWLDSRDKHLLEKSRNVFLIIVAFMLGIAVATYSMPYLGRWTLSLTIIPVAFVNLLLLAELLTKSEEKTK